MEVTFFSINLPLILPITIPPLQRPSSRFCLPIQPTPSIGVRASQMCEAMLGIDVAKCCGQGVSGICLRFTRQLKQHLHHVLDLVFAGGACTHYRLLYFPGRIFIDWHTLLHGRHNRRTTRMAKLQGRLGTFGHEYLFYGHFIRLELFDYLADTAKYLIESLRKL